MKTRSLLRTACLQILAFMSVVTISIAASIVLIHSSDHLTVAEVTVPPPVITPVVEPPLMSKYKSKEADCLARNIYYEARGEDDVGKMAVGMVTINRSTDPSFPKTLCGVISQSATTSDGDKVCQFSWFCNQRTISRPTGVNWIISQTIAIKLINGLRDESTELVDEAKYFHAASIRPGWRKHHEVVAEIGNHIFYK